MLIFNESNLNKWNKKIVYAPNSFGKTTVSIKILNYYKDQKKNCDIFTRRKIADLVSVNDKSVFVGVKSKLYKELVELKEKLDSTKTGAAVFGHIKEKSATKIKQNSFYASYIQIKNVNSIPVIDNTIKRKYLSLKKYSDEEIAKLDKSLSYSLFEQIKDFLEKSETIDTKASVDRKILMNDLVSDEIFQSLDEVYLYCKLNDVKQCFLCGKKYRSHDDLIEHIENRQKTLKRTNENILFELYDLSSRVVNLISNNDLTILRKLPTNNNTIKRQLMIVKLYYRLCLCDASYFQNKLSSIKLESNDESEETTVEEAMNRKNKLEAILTAKTKKEVEATQRYNTFVIKEINKLLRLKPSIEFRALDDAPGFEFYVDGKKNNPYDVLSESEIKLVSLVVLNAEIRYQHLEILILDDPIDSYDDYNKRIASNYISDLLKRRSLREWFIFTNDFECVYYLSQILKKDTVFNLDDIDTVFLGTNNPLEVVANPKNVQTIANNDLCYLRDFIIKTSAHFPYNPDILFCALTLTLRNLKTDILKDYSDVEINGITKARWMSDIRQYIESCSEHFDATNSPLLKICDVAKPFLALNTASRRSNAKAFSTNTSLFEPYRENIAKSPMPRNGDYTDVVNYLFKKILLINYIKYCFEKKLMLLIQTNFSQSDFNAVDSCKNGLYSRVEMAININNNNGYTIGNRLNATLKIHEKYSILYNSIDHGTSLIISPYLSVSIKDISDFNNAVVSF